MIAARTFLLVRLACECAFMRLPRRASCVTLRAQRYEVVVIVSATKVLRHNVIHLRCRASASHFLRLARVVITREDACTYACPLVSRAVDRATDVLAITLRPARSVSCYTHSIIPICEYPLLHLMFRPRKAMPMGWASIALRGRRTGATQCSARMQLFSCYGVSSGKVRTCTACGSRIPTPNRNVARRATLSESK